MAQYTYEQLTRAITIEEARATAIALLQSIGFKNAASWQPGSWPRTLGIEVPALIYVDLRELGVTLTKSMFNDTAAGAFLTVLSKSHFDNDREDPVKTRGKAMLVSASSAPPHTFAAQDLVIATQHGITFRNLAGATLNPGSSLELEWEAEIAGFSGNVPSGAITVLQTTLAGVTVSNPGAWITRVGADPELDAKLQTRNRTKWATRAYATPAAAYEHWALSADPAITRVFVDDQNPEGPGTVKIWIADAVGGADPLLADTVVDYIEGLIDGIVRRPSGAIVSADVATEHVVALTGTAYVSASYRSTAEPGLRAAAETHFASIPVGGTKTLIGQPGKVLLGAIYTALGKVPGVINVTLSSPTGDLTLDPDEVPKLVYNITIVAVA